MTVPIIKLIRSLISSIDGHVPTFVSRDQLFHHLSQHLDISFGNITCRLRHIQSFRESRNGSPAEIPPWISSRPNMATPQDYISMPWAPRSGIAPTDVSSETRCKTLPILIFSVYSANQQAATLGIKMLMEQLATAHTLQRHQECRIAELHVEMDRRTSDVLRSKEQRVGELVEEVDQCRKREAALEAVLVRHYRKEQLLAARERTLDYECTELMERKEKSQEERATIEQLEKRIDDVEKACKGKDEELARLRAKLHKQTEGTTSSATADQRIKRSKRLLETDGAMEMLKVQDKAKFDLYGFKISIDIMNGLDIRILRHHDYYAGWFDCVDRTRAKAVAAASDVPDHLLSFPSLFSIRSVENPEDAGSNAGALFTWAALSRERKPKCSVRLDDREWTLARLEKAYNDGIGYGDASRFWLGFSDGKKHA
jgi:hypothetical protein